jgi:aryl-alcohol dehydrogenase-like predicted oxidoreductase
MALDRSLERLKVDSVDLYQLHSVPVEEMQKGHVIEFLERAKKDQRIRAAGVSVYNLSGVQEALCHSVIDTVQVIVNMLSDKAELESIMSLCAIHQIGVIAREPLAQSLLTGKYDSSSQFGKNDHRAYKWTKEYLARELPRVEELRCLAREGRTLVQAALKYVLSFAQVSTVIPGARNLQQLRDNAKSSDLPPLTGEELDLIKSV